MNKRKVLFVCHNHPDMLVGGVEMYLRDVCLTLAGSDDFQPIVVARAGQPFTFADAPHADSPITLVGGDPNQYLVYTDFNDFDFFHGRLSRTKNTVSRAFRDLLLALEPDVVHFQHTAYIGYDVVRVTRNALPEAAIVYSFHEYLPICNRDGVMVRAPQGELCEAESPRRCHECFPDISPQTFFLRKRFIQSHLLRVDCFTAPSESVRDSYVAWGLPGDRFVVHPYAVAGSEVAPEPARSVRNRFGFFGQLNPYKGVDVLLRAMDALADDVDAHLWIHGANLDKQSEPWREHLGELLAVERDNVSFAGPYTRNAVAALMGDVDWVIVPSIWRETGPIVVLEAFREGRPVICSDIGGMSEKVEHGVNGLHFRRGDSEHLAHVIERACATPGLWDELRAGIPAHPARSLESNVADLTKIYERLLAQVRRRAETGNVTPSSPAPDTEQPIHR
jgi:glycosyltransferase involved in cell wall biosynthesis